MEKKLAVLTIIKNGIEIGSKNLVPIIVNVLLWILTIWIPYLNIGTTIGLVVGIISKSGKGEPISMTEIFDAKYRKYMGEFFLTGGLVSVGVGFGSALFVIPGIVIAIAWSFAILLAVDKGKNPTEAISLSNNLTYGNKAPIFLANLVLIVAGCILSGLFLLIPVIRVILIIALMVVMIFAYIGMQAYCYKELCGEA